MKRLVFLTTAILMAFSAAALAGDSLLGPTALDGLTDNAPITGKFGIYNTITTEADEDTGRMTNAWLELNYLSKPFKGLQAGLGLFGLTNLYENGVIEFKPDQDEHRHTAGVRELYLKYTIPGTESSFLLGRANMRDSCRTLWGDTHEGLMFTSTDLKNVTINAALINAFVYDFNYDDTGISEREEVSDFHEEAGENVYTLTVEARFGGARLKPFFGYFPRHESVRGLEADFSADLDNRTKVGLKGVYGYFTQETPDSISADDEDWTQYVIGPYVESGPFSVELGYWYRGDSNSVRLDSTSFLIYTFGSMKKLYSSKARGRNMTFLKAGVDLGPAKLSLQYARVIDRHNDGQDNAEEIDYVVKLPITDKLCLDAYLATVSYEADSTRNCSRFSAFLVYTF